MIRRAALYWNTLQHLRVRQIAARLTRSIPKLYPRLEDAPGRRAPSAPWTVPARREPSMTDTMTFSFLNTEHPVRTIPWGTDSPSLLWRYNLHYFDDLNARDSQDRDAWHSEAVRKWMNENPLSADVAWDPYPVSLRIVNWIKWSLGSSIAADGVGPDLGHSLATHARYLCGRLEYHLFGNHLFANAKALVFAGMFFEGPEARSWLERGLGVLAKEIPEQILADGGQFERSTMYHAIAYEDVLDLINIAKAFPSAIPNEWRSSVGSWPKVAAGMGRWLRAMTHPDGRIALFNDAAFDIAPQVSELERYASDLGLQQPPSDPQSHWTHLEDSGYVVVDLGPAKIFIDVAPVGPDYLPGHAHADTLSFELSVFGERVIVNGGTSAYGKGREREEERSTASHSTVTVDGANSSEVWAGFRVARRAKPFDLHVEPGPESARVTCAHDGYRRLPGRAVHRRAWALTAATLEVEDRVEGRYGSAVARYHLHPQVRCTLRDGHSGELVLQCGRELTWQAIGGVASLRDSVYAPQFGRRMPTRCIAIEFKGPHPVRLDVHW